MSTFFSTGLNKKIDALMDRLFGAGVASHATIIEQINYLMFLRALTSHDDEAKLLNPDHEEIFKGELAKYRWDNLLMLNAEVLFDTLEEAYRKLPELTTDKTVALLFRNAHIKVYDKPTLRVLLHEIEKLVTELDDVARHGSKDIFGDMYEYLLSKLAQAGTNGQFRTPRHIIKFILDVVDPEKGETILDPACGTAGFLVAALDHLRHKYSSERFIKDGAFPMDKLTGNERDFIFNHAFTGFDSDEDMVKFGVMNLFLHNLSNASIKRQNTLVDTAGDRTKWDVILANPPFAGKIEPESVSEDLRMGTRATEVLFVRYMIDHLSSKGKAGIIVPEGVIFQSTNAHKQLRQKLVDAGLWCVVSLPSGVFKPYSGVKTSILFIDKDLASKFNRIMFLTINSDGFDLSANRRSILQNDLPNALKLIQYCKKEIEARHIRDNYYFPFEDSDHSISIAPLLYSFEKVSRINEEEDITLQSERYKVREVGNQRWPLIELEKLLDYEQPTNYIVQTTDYSNKYTTPVLTAGKSFILGYTNEKIGVYDKRLPVIIFDDFTTATKLVDFNFKVKSSAMKILQARTSDIDISYVYYAMQNIDFKPKEHKRFWISQYCKFKIPVPPIDIQRQVTIELDNYQKVINTTRQLISLFKPSFQINPKWESRKLKELATITSSKRIFQSDYVNKGVPFFRTKEIAELELGKKISTELFISEEKYREISASFGKPVANDILVSAVGTIGKVWRIPEGFYDFYFKDGNILWLKDIKDLVLPEYLEVVTRSLLVNQTMSAGAAYQALTIVKFKELEIPIAPMDEQKQVVAQFNKEQQIINSNKDLIKIYEDKVNSKINELWA